MKRIACFITGGYTETNAMKAFLRKINSRVQYIQLCPTGKRKRRSQNGNHHIEMLDPSTSGLTGQSLIRYILQYIDQETFQQEKYDAILIEDDKDNNCLGIADDGTSTHLQEEWNSYQAKIIDQIHETIPQIPIMFLFAAPEIEAWFIADWENPFGSIYKEKLGSDNDTFKILLKKDVDAQLLTNRYINRIEEYGYFDGQYKKLSEELQTLLQSGGDSIKDHFPQYLDYNLKYSKRIEGENMLFKIDPDNVKRECHFIFQDGFRSLKYFDE